MNNKQDMIIGGEPYLALQLWLNIKSGKIISRIWDQTVSLGKIASVDEFSEVCLAHFKGRPCIGYPLSDPNSEQDFFVSQTPIPRKISRACAKLLSPGTASAVTSCPECFKLKPSAPNDEMDDIKAFTEDGCAPTAMMDLDTCINETIFKEDLEKAYKHEIKSVHKQDRHFMCDQCDYAASVKCNLTHHIQSVHGIKRDFKCHLCDYAASKKCNLTSHIRSVHEKRRNFKCSQCDYAAAVKWNLTIHIKSVHKKKNDFECGKYSFNSADTAQTDTETKSALKAEEISENEMKMKSFDNRHRYEIHKASHGGDPLYKACDICEKVVQCRQFRRHMENCHNINGPFYIECHWCEKKLSTYNYKDHAMRKHFYGNFICETCPFSCYCAKDLIAHVKEDHREDQFARCPSCKKEVLVTHLESHHRSCLLSKLKLSNTINRICDKCGKIFTKRKSLSEHKKSHLRIEGNDSLYYYCDKCDRKYVSSHALKVHVQSVHENIKFNCLICKMTFNTELKLKGHNAQIHSTDKRYECKVCGIRKDTEVQVRVHERIHEEYQFQCSFCPKKLRSQDTLTAHERQHTGEKPFKCSICSAGFPSKKSHLRHTREVHKIAGPRGGKTEYVKKKKSSTGHPNVLAV